MLVPSRFWRMTPDSRRTRKWWVIVDLETPSSIEPQAQGSSLLGQPAHDLEPLRVAEGVQDARQLDLIPLRVMQLRCVIYSHSSIVRR